MRTKESQRPWDRLRKVPEGQDITGLSIDQETDAFREQWMIPPTSMFFFAWMSEWDTQVKIACPWDKDVLVHRCTADLGWVLESQWGSPDAARELVKDACEDFHKACQRKGYLVAEEGSSQKRVSCVVALNGFWQARQGVLQGLSEAGSRFKFQWMADISPIPTNQEELYFPRAPEAPKVQFWRERMRMNDHQMTTYGR